MSSGGAAIDDAALGARGAAAPIARGARVVFAGPLPPPVTGMTAMTEVIVAALRREVELTEINWSTGKPLQGWRWRAARARGVMRTLARLAWRGAARGAALYMPVNSGAGLYYDLAIAALARRLGYRLVLHHHAYSYISQYDWRAARLDRLVGSGGAHAVHCSLMRDHFLAQYPSPARFLFVPPTIVSQQLPPAASGRREEFTLGFLSNLTRAKGVDEAIGTFERLAAAGRDVRLLLAGPCLEAEARSLVDAAVARWPERVEYRGPVYGTDKSRFLAELDAFLFPTRYRNESWGIVLTEAMSAGCPVISRSRGCVPWIVRGGCGLTVEESEDFVSAASALIDTWIDRPEVHQAARAAAHERVEELNADARRELPQFVAGIAALATPPPPTGA